MEALKQFDGVAGAAAPIVRESVIYNGFYTLTFPDGSHRTFRISTRPAKGKFAPGKRVISILIGPDNTSDYEMVGFVEERGITIWRSKLNGAGGGKLQEYAAILWDLAVNGEVIEGYELAVSRRCLKCNRPLTDPESIERGIGPVCAEVVDG